MGKLYAIVHTHKIKDIDSDYLDGYSDVLAIRATKDGAAYAAKTHAERLAADHANENSCTAEAQPKQGNPGHFLICSPPSSSQTRKTRKWEECDIVVAEVFFTEVSDIGEMSDWVEGADTPD